jgi:hypothetical protein
MEAANLVPLERDFIPILCYCGGGGGVVRRIFLEKRGSP